jgi:hypothetical protein
MVQFSNKLLKILELESIVSDYVVELVVCYFYITYIAKLDTETLNLEDELYANISSSSKSIFISNY